MNHCNFNWVFGIRTRRFVFIFFFFFFLDRSWSRPFLNQTSFFFFFFVLWILGMGGRTYRLVISGISKWFHCVCKYHWSLSIWHIHTHTHTCTWIIFYSSPPSKSPATKALSPLTWRLLLPTLGAVITMVTAATQLHLPRLRRQVQLQELDYQVRMVRVELMEHGGGKTLVFWVTLLRVPWWH
jgi:hypothetical protein